MLREWIQTAKEDRPVWLGDVRQALLESGDAVPVQMELELCSGQRRQFLLPVPRWEGEEQERFVREYVCACVFNALAALSGQRMTFYVPEGEQQAEALLRELPRIFQVEQKPRTGYGKAVAVADRLCYTFGRKPFSFEVRSVSEPVPVPEHTAAPQAGQLGERLRRAAQRADAGLYCGVDVGGTDIKLALARGGELVWVSVLDWNPTRSTRAEEIIEPMVDMIRQALSHVGGELLDGLGVSFPDVVIRDRIVGGETPKTRGMRENRALDYETQLRKLTALKDALAPCCKAGAPIRMTNDGHMAAFTAAMELACSPDSAAVERGVIAHSLGTDLGTGWLEADGTIPEIPLELYDFLLDLGSWRSRELPAGDLRCVCNENSGLPGVRRYIGQAGAFRLAYGLEPELLDGFAVREGETLLVQESPEDLRKPCLEMLMQRAQEGEASACAVFRQIGGHLAQVSRELEFLLHPATDVRFLFGRFVKRPCCFALLQEGCAQVLPQLRLEAADDELACTPLMAALSRSEEATVAQYGQAVGAIYFSLMEESANETQ